MNGRRRTVARKGQHTFEETSDACPKKKELVLALQRHYCTYRFVFVFFLRATHYIFTAFCDSGPGGTGLFISRVQ